MSTPNTTETRLPAQRVLREVADITTGWATVPDVIPEAQARSFGLAPGDVIGHVRIGVAPVLQRLRPRRTSRLVFLDVPLAAAFDTGFLRGVREIVHSQDVLVYQPWEGPPWPTNWLACAVRAGFVSGLSRRAREWRSAAYLVSTERRDLSFRHPRSDQRIRSRTA